MPDAKISALTALTAPSGLDELAVVDKSDTTDAASGTTKRASRAVLDPLSDAWYPTNAVSESVIGRFSNNLSGQVSQQLRVVAMKPVLGGTPINNITFYSGTTAAATPLNQWFCLVDQALNVLRKTVDDTTAAWAASTGKTLALTSTYTPPEDVALWAGIMIRATTVPTFVGLNIAAATGPGSVAPVLCGGANSGLTDPASLGSTITTPGGLLNVPYGYLS